MKTNGESISVAALRATHPRLRVDWLRTALREGSVVHERIARELPEWLDFFRETQDGAFRVLVLELLRDFADESVNDLLREATGDRADGVRLEALRALCQRFPEEIPRLAERHQDDDNLELQVLLAVRLHAVQPDRAEERLLAILRAEAGGPRERQALERVLGFFVEDAGAKHLLPRLTVLRGEFDDPEDFFGWAQDRLSD